MTPEDSAALAGAVQSLEHPGFAARLANMVGKPIELIGDALPTPVRHTISTATTKALQSALKVALRTMQDSPHAGSRLVHKVLATASGAAGGAFGLVTLPLELPARRPSQRLPEARAKILPTPKRHSHVSRSSALGERAGSTDASESGYFAVRNILAKSVAEAARFVAERGVIEEGAQIVIRFISQVASRFGVVLTQKFAAQALPVVGALGGASVNYLFIEHFQETAQHRAPVGKSIWKGHCTCGV